MAAVAAMEICNGERVVVFLFVVRILFSVPVSLAAEAAALCLLALAALLADVSAERTPDALRCFSARRGASSGILLGSVTMPAVLLSRLIQHSRSLSAVDFRRQELSYMEMQYWTISVSSLCVLISVYFILRHSTTSDDHNFLSLATVQNNKLGMLYLLFYVGTCYSSLATECTMCLLPIKKISWFILHGLACVGLIHHLLRKFPYCASIGEALLVSSSLVLYFGDMLAYTLLKINSFLLSSEPGYFHSERSEISTIIQGIIVGLLIFPVCYKFMLKLEDRFTSFREPGSHASERSTHTIVGKSVTFYALMAIMLTMIAPLWMQFVKDFQIHPLLWVFNFVFSEPSKRLLLCIYWIFIISASVYRFYNISKHSKIERILLRKYYHLVAVLIFSPAVLFQPKFLDLAFGAAFAAFLVLEMIRIWRIWPLGLLVNQFMNAFTDHRDSDTLIVSHFSLLLGCALPKWMSSTFNDRPLAAFAGILSLGIGDTMASVVGHKYGVLRWSKSGKKTIEGTAAGITSVMVACSILLPLLASTGYIYSQHWLSLLIAVTISGLLEAYTAQLDNAFIPLVFYSLLCL